MDIVHNAAAPDLLGLMFLDDCLNVKKDNPRSKLYRAGKRDEQKNDYGTVGALRSAGLRGCEPIPRY
jgi:hypothetical protein